MGSGDVISRADGFEATGHWIDEENGDSISISIFEAECGEDRRGAGRARSAASRRDGITT